MLKYQNAMNKLEYQTKAGSHEILEECKIEGNAKRKGK